MASGAFWWGFEWLNRFAGNWHYAGVEGYGPLRYAAHASLCFSTVLPAVTVTAEALGGAGWERGPRWPWLARPATGRMLLALGGAALFLVGWVPRFAYPALWLAPLALYFGEGILAGRTGLWTEVAQGDWRSAGPWMFAALICGFFWELWNFHSDPRWAYTVPGADRWHLFAMPLPGYAGYLPFGWECWAAASMLGATRRADRGAGG